MQRELSTVRHGRKRTRKASTSKSKSRSRTPSLRMLGRTLAMASSNVGLGASSSTVLRTSFFYNATAAAATGIFTGYLKPGSCFDPCGDLAAIQPQMFDQFAAAYSRYKVNSCKIRIKITGNQGSGAGNVWVAAGYPAVDPTALATYQAAASQQYAKTISGGFNWNQGAAAAAIGLGSDGKSMSFDLNHNAIVGAKSDTWDIGALVTADPTALQYMVLPVFLQCNANGSATWVLEIDMFQNVTFSQKKNTVDA